jgi:hemerythrin-like domain-containing protein
MRTRFNEADDAILEAFVTLYKDHMRLEETVAFPKASAEMDPERLKAMSRDMMSRRGVS